MLYASRSEETGRGQTAQTAATELGGSHREPRAGSPDNPSERVLRLRLGEPDGLSVDPLEVRDGLPHELGGGGLRGLARPVSSERDA